MITIYTERIDYDPEDDMDFTEDENYDEGVVKKFAEDMLDFLIDIVRMSDTVVESFTSDRNFLIHFEKHCLGRNRNRTSSSQRIYYDFTDSSQYSSYEKKISEYTASTDYRIDSLEDYDTVMTYMRKLFEGNCTVVFEKSCGLRGNKGPISLSFSAYSSNATKNYSSGNTIDVCIKGRGNRTVTLYAVDAHKVQSRLNNIIRNDLQGSNISTFTINND